MTTKTKIVGVGLVCILGILVSGYIYFTPHITVYQMKRAAENGDAAALSEHIDFPALRENFKNQANAKLGTSMLKLGGSPFAALGAALGGVLVESTVDSFITPAGLMNLMRGADIDLAVPGSDSTELADGGNAMAEPFSDVSMSYETFSTFSVTKRNRESGRDVKFILRRRGLDWKLTEIVLPL